MEPHQDHYFSHFDRFFIAVSSLKKKSQISNNASIKFAILAMNIDNLSMVIAVFFSLFYR